MRELCPREDARALLAHLRWHEAEPHAEVERLAADADAESGLEGGEDGDEALDDFDRLTDLMFQRINAFAEEEDVADELLALLLLRLAVTMRMAAYAMTTAKPSGGGLKLDLDRFRRDIEGLIRESKKDADRFIAQARESMAVAELEEDES